MTPKANDREAGIPPSSEPRPERPGGGATKSGNLAFEEARARGVLDTMIGFPMPREQRARVYDDVRKKTRDAESKEMEFPAQYMFKGVPHHDEVEDPVELLVSKMKQHNITKALTGLPIGGNPKIALERHPDMFIPSTKTDPNEGMEGLRKLESAVRDHGAKATQCWGTALEPAVPLNDKKMYPIYAKCIELDIPIFVYVGIPGPRIPFEPQYTGLLDEICWFFPELRIVTRHGAEPWSELIVKLLLKWPNLYYSTTAFAPSHYNRDIIDFANTRGADKIIYGGYYPMGLDIDRIFNELPDVPFRDHVWPKFLYENAARVLKLS